MTIFSGEIKEGMNSQPLFRQANAQKQIGTWVSALGEEVTFICKRISMKLTFRPILIILSISVFSLQAVAKISSDSFNRLSEFHIKTIQDTSEIYRNAHESLSRTKKEQNKDALAKA